MADTCSCSCKVSIILEQFEAQINSFHWFKIITPVSKFINICLVGAGLFLLDGRTDGRAGGRREGQRDITRLDSRF